MPRRGFSTGVKISVIGLGKLGAPLAVVLASKGFDVVGADLNQAPVDAITSRISPVDEPDLQELIDGSGVRLTVPTRNLIGVGRATDRVRSTSPPRGSQHPQHAVLAISEGRIPA